MKTCSFSMPNFGNGDLRGRLIVLSSNALQDLDILCFVAACF
jgi:hypothetical protein